MASRLGKSVAWHAAARSARVLGKFVAIFLVAGCAVKSWALPCFDDQALAQLAQQSPSLVYVWSPRMVLSVQHAGAAQHEALLQGLRFVAVHDGQVPADEIMAALQRAPQSHTALHNSQALCASALAQRDALRHFPTGFVLRSASLHRHPVVGAMPEAAWASSLAQRLADSAGFEPVQRVASASHATSTSTQSLSHSASAGAQQCIAANTFSPLPASLAGEQTDSYGTTRVALGSYERISPDGRFVLRSFSGGKLGEVSLIELDATGQAVAAFDTPLSNEAFPVQGSWRYVVDVNGDHYNFSSLLSSNSNDKSRIRPLFSGGMNGFYAAAAELPAQSGQPAGQVRIRSMSWPNANGPSDSQGEGALVARTLTVDTARQRIVADSGPQRLCAQRVREDGPMYALPMISVNGLEFAALPQTPVQGAQTMRIFGFGKDGHGCEPSDTFNFSSGKTIFGFAQGASHAAPVAYEYQSQVWWVLREANIAAGFGAAAGAVPQAKPFNIAPYYANPRTQLLASAFPGITQDGRVIYGATLKSCPEDANKPCTEQVGYVTSDPFQSNAYQNFVRQAAGSGNPAMLRQCITQADVQRSRNAFAKLHSLAP